jgi:hypothetical protein
MLTPVECLSKATILGNRESILPKYRRWAYAEKNKKIRESEYLRLTHQNACGNYGGAFLLLLSVLNKKAA